MSAPHTIASLQRAYAARTLEPQRVVRHFIEAIERSAHNAFVSTADRDACLTLARSQHAAMLYGDDVGPLAGIPIAIKDNLCIGGHTTTAGSRMLAAYTSPFHATSVARLLEAGAILVGTTNLDAFAMGSTGESSHFGPTHHPSSPAHAPGGSSSGSATAVAAGLCAAALGSDTGGSARLPAAHCGVVGFKPTYGRVSRHGLIAHASSLDHVCPITRTVTDAAILYALLAGHDPQDATSLHEPAGDVLSTLDEGAQGMRIGVCDALLEGQHEAHLREALSALELLGATLVPVRLPLLEWSVATYVVLACAEASTNLSRYDGVRFGHRSAHVEDLHALIGRSRAEGFEDEVIRRIILGTFVLQSGHRGAFYERALGMRRAITGDFAQAFEEVDALLGATTVGDPPRLGEQASSLTRFEEDRLTIPASLAGLPALTVPIARSAAGFPVGAHIMGPRLGEAAVLRVGRALERAMEGA